MNLVQLVAAALEEILRLYTVTLAAFAIAAVFAIRARRQHRVAPETTSARLRWYWPVFIAGFQCVGGLQGALRCDGLGVGVEDAMDGVRASLIAAVLVIAFGSLAALAIERIASPLRRPLFLPLPVLAAMIAVVLNWGLVVHLFGDSLWRR